MKTQEKTSVYEKEILIIRKHILKYFNEKNFRMNKFTPRAVNDAVIEILERAIERAKLSKRRTIFPKDI